jgi:hypothetical protein
MLCEANIAFIHGYEGSFNKDEGFKENDSGFIHTADNKFSALAFMSADSGRRGREYLQVAFKVSQFPRDKRPADEKD